MRALATALLLVSTALAYQVTYPGGNNGWTTTGPNTVQWERVDTDPSTFAMFLTNENGGNDNQLLLLNAVVNGSLGSVVANAPSGGWSTGSGFRVNFAQDSSHPNSLLAQSSQFNITAGSSTQSGTTQSSTASGSTASTQTGTNTATTANGATSSISSSATSTTPTGTNAAPLRAGTPAGLLTAAAAVAAFFAALF